MPARHDARNGRWQGATSFLAIAAGTAATAAIGVSPERPWQAISAYLAASLCWLGALAWLRGRAPGRRALWLGALALRLIALAGEPRTSDDVWRAAWEAGLVGAGQSPYAWAPSDARLDPFRTAWPEVAARVGHPEISAAYLPTTQVVQALAVASAGGPAQGGGRRATFALRLAAVLCELGGLFAFERLLARRGAAGTAALAWAWSPLMALEFAGSAHHDALGLGLLVAALLALHSGRAALAGAALALAAWVKPVPLALFPVAWLAIGASAGRLWFLAGAALASALVWTPMALLGGGLNGLTRGLAEYGRHWAGGSLAFRWIERALSFGCDYDQSWTDPRRLGRLIAGVAWLSATAWAWRRWRDVWRTAGTCIGAWIVLAPVLHPWYLAWLVPFAAERRSSAGLALLGVAPVLFAPLPGWLGRREWIEPAWVWWVLAAAPLAAWASARLRARLARAAAAPVEASR
jgi:hypothetical protein